MRRSIKQFTEIVTDQLNNQYDRNYAHFSLFSIDIVLRINIQDLNLDDVLRNLSSV